MNEEWSNLQFSYKEMTTAFDFGKLFILYSINLKISQTKPLQLLHVLQVAAPSPVSTAPD